MNYEVVDTECKFCGISVEIHAMEKGNSYCFGGIKLSEEYYVDGDSSVTSKKMELICPQCKSRSSIIIPITDSFDRSAAIRSELKAQGGALTIRHKGTVNPGIVNFSMLYPVPPQVDSQGNIPLPVGGEIKVFQAVVGDIYIFRQIDPPIEVINESPTGYFEVSRKLHNEPAFTQKAYIWGKNVCSQHPHLQNSITYDISHPGDRIHITYHAFSRYLLDNNHITDEQFVSMPADEQFDLLNKILKVEK